MILSIIAAMTDERVIGKDSKLPWHLSEDLKRFKSLTLGHPVIMGRKTYESIGKPLPGRHNIVLTRKRPYTIDGVTVSHSIEDAVKIFDNQGRSKEELFFIGGFSVFKDTLPSVDKLYLTLVHKSFEGDTYFPPFDLEKDFVIDEKSDHRSSEGGGFSYTFLTASRKRS